MSTQFHDSLVSGLLLPPVFISYTGVAYATASLSFGMSFGLIILSIWAVRDSFLSFRRDPDEHLKLDNVVEMAIIAAGLVFTIVATVFLWNYFTLPKDTKGYLVFFSAMTLAPVFRYCRVKRE